MIDEERLKAIEERYTRKPIPDCPLCGAVLIAGQERVESIIWRCPNAANPGREAYEHFKRSQFEQRRGDGDVLDLVAEVRRLQAIERVVVGAISLLKDWRDELYWQERNQDAQVIGNLVEVGDPEE